MITLSTALFLLHATIITVVSGFINRHVPEPYMDEIFHIPQAQQYCWGAFNTWHPKITTLPGLYLFTAPLGLLSPKLCTTANLRAINGIFGILLYPLFLCVLKKVQPRINGHEWTAFGLALFPVLWFFNFLYYTDVGSALFVIGAYFWSLERRYWLSALFSAISVLFRQTNIIWVSFILGTTTARILADRHIIRESPASSVRNLGNAVAATFDFVSGAIQECFNLIGTLYPYLFVLAGFFAFLHWNQGIVLGDRDHHVATAHFPLVYYYVSFAAGIASPALFQFAHVAHFLKATTGNPVRQITTLSVLFLVLYTIRYNTIEHDFLLSDNRHFSFYVWKDIYGSHILTRYLLAPAYLLAIHWCWTRLAELQTFIWCLGYWVAVGLMLVPTPLFDFRYFILPYVFMRLHVRNPTSGWRLWLELIMETIVNATVGYIFVYQGFEWPQEPGIVQRFMW
ncbi:uncharacterized protein VTP21DRAFT_5777 [Calcarisporiella thermophila]|uniref:uncharacterized protein n=1 Tax=Calcarisporiella thermophila TaxID=911321 RepID=UPI0037431AEE